MSQPLDTIIIGAGTAGLAALREVRKRTDRYLIVNEGPWGTTCARVGCMPSKALIEAANAFHRRHTFEEFGLRGASALTADLPAVLQRVRTLRDDFVAGALHATSELGSAQVSGRATLLGPTRWTSTAPPMPPAASSSPPGLAPACRKNGSRWATACSPPTPCSSKPPWAPALP